MAVVSDIGVQSVRAGDFQFVHKVGGRFQIQLFQHDAPHGQRFGDRFAQRPNHRRIPLFVRRFDCPRVFVDIVFNPPD